MFRRDFFKMLVGAAASVVCAPLAKLLPERESKSCFAHRFKIGQTINIRKPQRYFVREDLALSAEDFAERFVRPRFKLALDAEEKMREARLRDLNVMYGQAFEEGRIRIVEPDGTVKLLRA